MRGGLDDALDKLARRDELRRRAAGEATGTSPAVSELVTAIAAVVGRNPQLGVTVGVEGAGEPLLLHFYFGDGQVQVNAENAITRPADAEPAPPRYADFDVEAEEANAPADQPGPDEQDRFAATPFGYAAATTDDQRYAESDTVERRYGGLDAPPDPRYADMRPDESSRDLGARLRDLGLAATHTDPGYPPRPFAPTARPEVPPQAGPTQPLFPQPTAARPDSGHAEFAPPDHAEPTVRLPHDLPRHPAGHTAERIPHQTRPPEQRAGMPSPLPKPIPLKVERPEETEMAARRLAALLRDDPSLLNRPTD